jgi:hypothetical protein
MRFADNPEQQNCARSGRIDANRKGAVASGRTQVQTTDKVPVSDEYKIQPSLFYTWHRQLLESMSAALEDRWTRRAASTVDAAQQRKIAALEAELEKKDVIIAFVSEEHLALKKKRGES